jgi:hypothetical protein
MQGMGEQPGLVPMRKPIVMQPRESTSQPAGRTPRKK